jgi:transposase InsO family protein
MEVHARAPLSPIGRRRVVDRVVIEKWSVAAAAEAAGVTERTVYRWLARWRTEGPAGLVDRRSVPGRIPHKTPTDRVVAICRLRRLRLTGAEISTALRMPLSTVSAVLKREGLGKRSRLAPVESVCRYERSAPGELIHVDVKKLGRIVGGPGKRITGHGGSRRNPALADAAGVRRGTTGWEAVHVAIDDHSRLAYVEVLGDEKAHTSVAFLRRAVAFFAGHGVHVQRVMTDNGSPYISHVHAIACRQLGIRHLRTRPYRPQTNGKVERFHRILLEEWAYIRDWTSEAQRVAGYRRFLHFYNQHRSHGALGWSTPMATLTRCHQDNVPAEHT